MVDRELTRIDGTNKFSFCPPIDLDTDDFTADLDDEFRVSGTGIISGIESIDRFTSLCLLSNSLKISGFDTYFGTTQT
mgnify:CR=1 FL=1